MDPAAMVAHLDARALEEATELRPKTYLVLAASVRFLKPHGRIRAADMSSLQGLSLPFPGHSWYGFNIWPVGPSLRVVDEKRGIEPDMCVPIFPNEVHPAGRAPVRPSSAFPYNHCYHWVGLKMDVRVHAREEGFDNARAIRLPAGDRVDMTALFGLDRGRAKRTRLARDQAASLPPDCVSAPESSSPPTTGSEQPENATTSVEVDIFAPQKDMQDPEYTPLFHLWLDLPENLKQEDIGDPVDLYKERYAIMR